MELSEVISKRRSIRKYDSSKEVTKEQIQTILEAGINAPSSGNTQCWHFIVVQDENLRKQLSTDAGHQPFIAETPYVIVVCIDYEVSKKYGDRGVETYSLQDTAAAIENMLLTITDLGLSSCWIGAFEEEGAKKILNLPENLRPVAMLPIGYSDQNPGKPKRKTLENVVEWR